MNRKLLLKFALIILSLALSLAPARCVFSLPEPEQIVSGSAEFNYPNSSTLEINASDKTIVNYKSFDIAGNEAVIVNLSSSSSEFLNRVTGSSISQLLGSLTSNGIFILVNPNGIVFGPNASVDVAGLIASTRDITNSDFLSSNYLFNKLSTEQLDRLLLNKGTINIQKGGFGVLIAGAVENQGSIICPLGTIALAAGDMVRVDLSNDGLISVAIDQATAAKVYDLDGNPVIDQIKNTGTLKADGGVVLLKAESIGDIFKNAINLESYLSAVKAEDQDGIIKMLTQRDIIIDATLFATEIEIGKADETIPRNVTFQGGTITAEEDGLIVLADNNIQTKADIASTGDIELFADYDGDGSGEFSQLAGTIEAKSSGDIYIDGSGTMTLGTIKTEEGAIKIGSQRAPTTISGEPHYIHSKGDFEITNTERQADTVILETTRDDLLRYNSTGSLTLEAQSGKILDLTDIPLAGSYLNLIAQGFLVNSSSLTTEIYKNSGNLEISNVQSQDNLLTLEGEDVKVTYLKSNNLTLRADGAVNTSAGVIIQASQVRIFAKQFGSIEVPLTISAGLTYINRTSGDIEIMQSLGIGSTVMLRGPPDGFGAIMYNQDTQLTLEAENVVFNGNFTLFNDFTIEGNLKVVSGEIRGSGTKGSPIITVKKDLIFSGSGYTYFGYRDLLGDGDYRFSVNLEGNLTLDNPNAWVYSDINFTGSNDQAISYTQGTIYGTVTINKSQGALNYGDLNLTQLPLYFIPNQGQILDTEVKFYVQLGNNLLYFTPTYLLYMFSQIDPATNTLTWESIKLEFLNANPNTQISGELANQATFNYLLGNDPSKYITDLASYFKIVYADLYPGIDLVYSSKEGKIESEFVVRPNANYQDILLSYTGIDGLTIDTLGNLIIQASNTQLLESKPYVYQMIAGQTQEINAEFNLLANNTYNFNLEGYNPNYPIVIDPTLSYSTYLGGSDQDVGYSLAIDSSGNVYIAGRTWSSNLPATSGAYDTGLSGLNDAFVAKLNSTGSGLIYCTYFGGIGEDAQYALAVDSSGNAYITGQTGSVDFPTTTGAYDRIFTGPSEAFVTKFNSTGTALIYSTYLGGNNANDVGRGIAVDSSGNAYVTGYTDAADFPTTAGAYDTSYNGGTYDGFITKLNSTGSDLIYSTFLGGSGEDIALSIVIDSSGNAYVSGWTASTNFPTASAYDTGLSGTYDAFVVKLNADGSGLVYSTYLGGSGTEDYIYSMAIDSSGNAYVTGYTNSTDFPTTSGAYDTSYNGGTYDGFVTKLNSSGSALIYSTYLGGSGTEDYGLSLTIDSSSNAYVTGYTNSTDFPTTSDAYDTSYNGGSYDMFVTKLNSSGSALSYSTYLGGSGDDLSGDAGALAIAVDSSGNAYFVGSTSSTDFPTTSGAYDTSYNGGAYDVFVFKFSGLLDLPTVPPPSEPEVEEATKETDTTGRLYIALAIIEITTTVSENISLASGESLVSLEEDEGYGFDYGASYEGKEEKYQTAYVPGKYRTVVILFEGKVLVVPYDQAGLKENEASVLLPGDRISQEGLVEPKRFYPSAKYRSVISVFSGEPLKVTPYDKTGLRENEAVVLAPGEKFFQETEVK